MTINYPWNEIIRTSFIRSTNWQFSTARINEDILPHWAAYMNAGRFLAINTSLTTHRLVPGREQHTNTFDERRLEMFKALEDAEKLFAENRIFRAKYYPVFVISKRACSNGSTGRSGRICVACLGNMPPIPTAILRTKISTGSIASIRALHLGAIELNTLTGRFRSARADRVL